MVKKKKKETREGWAEAARECHKNDDDKLFADFSNEFDDEEPDWHELSDEECQKKIQELNQYVSNNPLEFKYKAEEIREMNRQQDTGVLDPDKALEITISLEEFNDRAKAHIGKMYTSD